MHNPKKFLKLKGMTLLEVLVVIVIVGILLTVTLYLGRDYLKTMQVRTDKEYFTAQYNQVMAIARTSNYHKGEAYEHIVVTLSSSGLTALTDDGSDIGSYTLEDGTLAFSGSMPQFTVLPYDIGCSIDVGSGVDFSYVSSINDDVYCYSVSDSTCKLLQVSCD